MKILYRFRLVAIKRTVALKLAFLFLLQCCWPTISLALTSGPSQPEVQGFTPFGTSEMVNVFTGDFNYNIPLLEIDGYPINLSYQSGVGMEDEASCVGLGWNLNVGNINRSMRGLPDDFKGDQVEKTQKMKPNKTIGFGTTMSPEFFGFDVGSYINFGFKLGFSFNNYTGFGFQKSASISINSSSNHKGPLTGSLGLTSDTNTGISLQPSLSLTARANRVANSDSKLDLSIGSSFNSRSGVKYLSFSAGIERNSVTMASGSSSFAVGTQTYSPSQSMSMVNSSFSGRFTTGGEIFGIHGLVGLNAYSSSQGIMNETESNPAYGYLYSEYGASNPEAIMDFNREKDIPYVPNIGAIGIPNNTNDVYAVSGQGIGGSYRPFRSEVGYVFDARSTSESVSDELGIEVGTGNILHGGYAESTTDVTTTSGNWGAGVGAYTYGTKENNSFYEPAYFREANEMGVSSEPEWKTALGGDKAVRVGLVPSGDFGMSGSGNLIDSDGQSHLLSSNKRTKRENRNSLMNTITVDEAQQGYSIFRSVYGGMVSLSSAARPHHIGEISVLGNDGMCYYYSDPVYNKSQVEVTFAIGSGLEGSVQALVPTADNLVNYSNMDPVNNNKGLDNYYSKTTTPGYAYTYLLSAIVSSDYVDLYNNGPTPDDFGTYTIFRYLTASTDYKWRAPLSEDDNRANYSSGLMCDPQDDKASYVYGTKEIKYLEKIETKNFVAFFQYEPRSDARGANDENGGVSSNQEMQRLMTISLYSTEGFLSGESPIKVVHFDYTYELCEGLPNSSEGKLTLKSVYFTFGDSFKGKMSPYTFEYSDFNPSYDKMAVDRWGNYKPHNPTTTNPGNDFYPYSNQDESTVHQYASAWHLEKIYLPSGGIIEVTYESDDYQYVQDKPAMEMVKILGTSDNDSYPLANLFSVNQDTNEDPIRYYFEFDEEMGIGAYIPSDPYLYLKVLVNIPPEDISALDANGDFEYLPVYAKIGQYGYENEVDPDGPGPMPEGTYGYVTLQNTIAEPGSSASFSPIALAAVNFGKLNAPTIVYSDHVAPQVNDDSSLGIQLLNEFLVFVTETGISELFQHPISNRVNAGVGKYIQGGKSFMRMKNPYKRKFGGGTRVKRITLSDNWESLSEKPSESSSANTFKRGQEYWYFLEDGSSSGVATYEPILGGDENPFRQPIHYDIVNRMAPDEARFVETPFGESMYPGPSVGYSSVFIRDITIGENDSEPIYAPGFTIQEFYTAKDFPTIAEKTSIEQIRQKTDEFSINNLLSIDARDYMSVSQGFLIELNDMHGKQKKQSVFSQSGFPPISYVEYKYKSEAYNGARRLNNNVTVLDEFGNKYTAAVGEHLDMVVDSRQEKTVTDGSGTNWNLDIFTFLGGPFALLIPIPQNSHEENGFRSLSTTKLVQKMGVLESVKAVDNTSSITTENLAYDAITGGVLVTRTVNQFEDPVYSLTMPAHWYYDSMGPAFENINFETILTFDAAGRANYSNAGSVFVPGDELITAQGRAWVVEVYDSYIVAQRQSGSPVTAANSPVKIIRSGRRNVTSAPMSQLTLKSNPLNSFGSNVYEEIIQASAIEYKDDWNTMCDCMSKDGVNFISTNPYVLGIRGNWKAFKNYTYLTDRQQSYYNGNTNIRRDGVFIGFNSFYNVNEDGDWYQDRRKWTWVSEISLVSPYGNELENVDPLGRYSAARFGFGNTQPTAVGSNTRYNEMYFVHLEDEAWDDCGNGVTFKGSYEIGKDAHTGRKALKLTDGQQMAVLFTNWDDCEESSCDMTIELIRIDAGRFQLNIINGTPGYTLNHTVLSGNPLIGNLSGNTTTISMDNISAGILEIIDATGCVRTVNYQY